MRSYRQRKGCFMTFPSLAQTWRSPSGTTLNPKQQTPPERRLLKPFQAILTVCWRRFQVSAEDPNKWMLICTQLKTLEFYTSLLKTSPHAPTCRSPGRRLLKSASPLYTPVPPRQGVGEARGNHSPLPPLPLSVILHFILYGL